MNRLFLTDEEVMDYYSGLDVDRGDAGMYCQWKDGRIEPLSDAMYSCLNDWWWYIDNGYCRVWQRKPSLVERERKWKKKEGSSKSND